MQSDPHAQRTQGTVLKGIRRAPQSCGLNSERGASEFGGTPRIRAMARIRMARAEFGGPRIQAPLPNSDLPLLNSDHPRPPNSATTPEFGGILKFGGGQAGFKRC